MAKDMRIIVCILKILQISSRIGRYCIEIMKIVKEISDKPYLVNLINITHMTDLVIGMVDDLIAA